MRGGVSYDAIPHLTRSQSSPHAWGCFSGSGQGQAGRPVFPTCVGVFLPFAGLTAARCGLPHMRGGVSLFNQCLAGVRKSSPHAWGCFAHRRKSTGLKKVFPTCVGVFLSLITRRKRMHCLPHMRGGISQDDYPGLGDWWSSPHAWGCFFHHLRRDSAAGVFPTRVGVFPCSWPSS